MIVPCLFLLGSASFTKVGFIIPPDFVLNLVMASRSGTGFFLQLVARFAVVELFTTHVVGDSCPAMFARLCPFLAFPFHFLLGTAIWAESEPLARWRPNQFAASPHARAGAGGSRPTLLALALAALAITGNVFPADFVTDDVGATHLGARFFEVNVPTTLAELRCVRTCLVDDFRSAAFAPSRPEVFVYACASTSPTIKCFARFGIEPT